MKKQYFKYIAKVLFEDFLMRLSDKSLDEILDILITFIRESDNKVDDKLLPALQFAKQMFVDEKQLKLPDGSKK